ncbi:MAG: type 1 glutamine amidotransferase [Phycisphaerales bacterium]|nr:type 1 glutamine amidotransferase [Phycisphaerales bacterium]
MPTLILQHSPYGAAGNVGTVLIEHGLRLETIRLDLGESLPPDLDGVDGIVTCGGPASATDDALPWLAQEMAMLKAAHAVSIPILGICLGSQVLARALGGVVQKMPNGPSVGLMQVNLNPAGREDPLFRGLPWYGEWPSWHEDEVSELPPGATLLASSDRCKVEAWHLGVFSYGLQFHAEWTSRGVAEICDEPARLPSGANVDTAAIRADAIDQAEAIDRQSRRFAQSVASYFMTPDRVNPGIVKDLHY